MASTIAMQSGSGYQSPQEAAIRCPLMTCGKSPLDANALNGTVGQTSSGRRSIFLLLVKYLYMLMGTLTPTPGSLLCF